MVWSSECILWRWSGWWFTQLSIFIQLLLSLAIKKHLWHRVCPVSQLNPQPTPQPVLGQAMICGSQQALFSSNQPDIRMSDNNQWLPAANQQPTCLVTYIPCHLPLSSHSPFYFLLNAISTDNNFKYACSFLDTCLCFFKVTIWGEVVSSCH